MFGKKKHVDDESVSPDSDYIELKKTIWSLQTVAASLQKTASDFEDRLQELRNLNLASPNYRENE